METFMHYTQFTSDWLLQVVTDTSQWCDMSHHRTVLTGGGGGPKRYFEVAGGNNNYGS